MAMINKNLRVLRKRFKYTQEDVADYINVSRQSIAKWENGETLPDISNCIALSNLYKVSLDDLVHFNEALSKEDIKPKGKHVFGVVRVSEGGSITIPKEAREIFDINVGDQLLMLGDEDQGLALVKNDVLKDFADLIMKAQEAIID